MPKSQRVVREIDPADLQDMRELFTLLENSGYRKNVDIARLGNVSPQTVSGWKKAAISGTGDAIPQDKRYRLRREIEERREGNRPFDHLDAQYEIVKAQLDVAHSKANYDRLMRGLITIMRDALEEMNRGGELEPPTGPDRDNHNG